MIEMFSKVWSSMPKRIINTHEDADHVWGNQLFPGAEIIAHRSVPERMKHVAEPKESQKLLHGVNHFLTRLVLKVLHPGIVAAGQQLLEDYNFDGIELVLPTTLFDTRYELDLDGTEVHLIYVGPCHQVGDIIIHIPNERVVFAGRHPSAPLAASADLLSAGAQRIADAADSRAIRILDAGLSGTALRTPHGALKDVLWTSIPWRESFYPAAPISQISLDLRIALPCRQKLETVT